MNIITKDELKNIAFDAVRVIEENEYRRFRVIKDGVVVDYYLKKEVPQKVIPPVHPIVKVDIPDFMKRRHQEMMAKQKPLKVKRTRNQELTFAFWLNQVYKTNDGGRP